LYAVFLQDLKQPLRSCIEVTDQALFVKFEVLLFTFELALFQEDVDILYSFADYLELTFEAACNQVKFFG
jgi:hypothetical protein